MHTVVTVLATTVVSSKDALRFGTCVARIAIVPDSEAHAHPARSECVGLQYSFEVAGCDRGAFTEHLQVYRHGLSLAYLSDP